MKPQEFKISYLFSEELYGDFEDLETGEMHEGKDNEEEEAPKKDGEQIELCKKPTCCSLIAEGIM
jgi:hypothetical protein